MNIPKLHYISQGATPEAHLNNIQQACTYGAKLVQLRLKNEHEDVILDTAKKARAITAHYQTRLIINDHYKIAKAVKADGVHLGKTDACPTIAREYLGKWYMIGGTANTLEDCKNLLDKKINYIGLGPFKFTQTKDNLSPILGLEGYQKILEKLQTQTPIIAIGGICENDINDLKNKGVYGIAMSKEITKDFSKITTINKLLNASATQEQRHTF
ncbi:thiamine phosphate synthase [Gaetbulibacter saemankumensis]|uniref:thiamine phosphate synthase n=1 Tax=Gaetbulibacter saemankumensis TaxID=311208 RepID=UPI0004208BD3|nr:thiamine phosphate synthase [Gaetbulibacter saemankumensis]